MTKKNTDKLVKVDEIVFNLMRDYVEENKLEYPSMKHFVERAIILAMGLKRFDIEGTERTYDEKAPLHKVVGKSQKAFTMCVVCDRPFLRNPEEGEETSKICPNCKNTIAHFAPKIVKQREDLMEEPKKKRLWHKLKEI